MSTFVPPVVLKTKELAAWTGLDNPERLYEAVDADPEPDRDGIREFIRIVYFQPWTIRLESLLDSVETERRLESARDRLREYVDGKWRELLCMTQKNRRLRLLIVTDLARLLWFDSCERWRKCYSIWEVGMAGAIDRANFHIFNLESAWAWKEERMSEKTKQHMRNPIKCIQSALAELRNDAGYIERVPKDYLADILAMPILYTMILYTTDNGTKLGLCREGSDAIRAFAAKKKKKNKRKPTGSYLFGKGYRLLSLCAYHKSKIYDDLIDIAQAIVEKQAYDVRTGMEM